MRTIVELILAVALLVGLWLGVERATAQEMEVIAGGEIEYQNYCAV